MNKSLIILIVIALTLLVGCSNMRRPEEVDKDHANATDSLPKVSSQPQNVNPVVTIEPASTTQATIKDDTISTTLNPNGELFKVRDIVVENKPVLNLNYDQVIKLWGNPKEIKKIKIHFPATEESDNLYLLSYDNIDVEMYPEQEDVPLEETKSFRFDITGSKYEVLGMRIGMDVEEYYKKFGERQEYLVSDINSGEGETDTLISIRKILTDLKEPNYYNSYEKAFYIGGTLIDEDENITGAVGFVVLINNNRIARIVYGLPTAG